MIILKLAKLLAHLRAVVSTWETDDSQGLEYAYGFATIEDPSRAMTQLRNLARGHALIEGRNYITMEDIPILIKTVFSTASLERVRVFELLLAFGGKLTTTKIEESLNVSDKTAKRTMAEFKAIGLVDVGEIDTQHGGYPEKQIILVEKLDWFLNKEFDELNNSERKEKPPCVTSQNYNYERSVLLNSILPRTGTEHIPFFSSVGISNEVRDSNQNMAEPQTRLPQEEKRPCLICQVVGIRKPVGRLKSGGIQWEVVHDDGKRCYWTEETDEQMWPLGEI